MKPPEEVWKRKWERREKTYPKNLHQFPLWNYEYELMYSILHKEKVVSPRKICLEAGSGTGRLSLKLGEYGVKPILLDISKKAIEFSKKLAHRKNVEGDFVVGSVLSLPFRSSCQQRLWLKPQSKSYEVFPTVN